MKRIFLLLCLLLIIFSLSIGVFAANSYPRLSLDIMVVATATPGINAVYFIAKLDYVSPTKQTIYIDFYNGSPTHTAYPNNYLGSVPVDNTGKAQLRIANHKSGNFAGGGIWAKSPWGKIFAPVKTYYVP